MMAEPSNPAPSYDEIPYPARAFPQTHPDNLVAIATLFGLSPPEVATARVLELGCAAGGNLIPLADAYPQATFVGIDGSRTQIAAGQRIVHEVGLSNISLQHQDILTLAEELGQFDYILCHGVYSWVPPPVQEKILALCATQLAPTGIAYVSYNTFPGWHARGVLRDLLCYHTAKFTANGQRIEQARAMLDFVLRSLRDEVSPFALQLKDEAAGLQNQSDSYLFHDHLEAVNSPLYFHEFVARARAHQLQYLGEAHVATMLPGSLGREVERTLLAIGKDMVDVEQYLDFLRNRMFRQTLLVHADAKIRRVLDAQAMDRVYVSAQLREDGSSESTSSGKEAFVLSKGVSVSAGEPAILAALSRLRAAWPQAVAFAELVDICEANFQSTSVGPSTSAPRDVLAQMLLQGYLAGGVHFHAGPLPVANTISDRPLASRLARYQANAGEAVVNRRHHTVALDPVERMVLSCLDGQSDRDAIVTALAAGKHGASLVASPVGAASGDASAQRQALAVATDEILAKLRQSAMLALD
jgi:methyltransferase-like protein